MAKENVNSLQLVIVFYNLGHLNTRWTTEVLKEANKNLWWAMKTQPCKELRSLGILTSTKVCIYKCHLSLPEEMSVYFQLQCCSVVSNVQMHVQNQVFKACSKGTRTLAVFMHFKATRLRLVLSTRVLSQEHLTCFTQFISICSA